MRVSHLFKLWAYLKWLSTPHNIYQTMILSNFIGNEDFFWVLHFNDWFCILEVACIKRNKRTIVVSGYENEFYWFLFNRWEFFVIRTIMNIPNFIFQLKKHLTIWPQGECKQFIPLLYFYFYFWMHKSIEFSFDRNKEIWFLPTRWLLSNESS